MKAASFTLLTLFSISSFATPKDVVDLNKKIFVKVTKDKGDVSFEKCQVKIPTKCIQIGHQPSYTVSELRSQRSKEAREVIYSAVGDVALAASTFVGTAYVLIGVGLGVSVGQSLLSAYSVPDSAPVVGGLTLDALNPFEQHEQKKTLDEDIIQDKLVTVDDISKYIKRLETVLNKIK